MPNVFDHVFNIVNTALRNSRQIEANGIPAEDQTNSMQVLIRCQFVEIYNEDIRDLLCKLFGGLVSNYLNFISNQDMFSLFSNRCD